MDRILFSQLWPPLWGVFLRPKYFFCIFQNFNISFTIHFLQNFKIELWTKVMPILSLDGIFAAKNGRFRDQTAGSTLDIVRQESYHFWFCFYLFSVILKTSSFPNIVQSPLKIYRTIRKVKYHTLAAENRVQYGVRQVSY